MVNGIRFENVEKIFYTPSGEEVHALNGVDLEIEEGDFVCFIGPSGCGKSTLLRILAGLDTPTKGSVYLGGDLVTKPGHDRGLVFQDPNLFPWLNIRDNVAFALKTRHIYKENKAAVGEMIDMVGLTGFEKSYPHQLSGGMCQRAAIARALVGKPKALLLDEPLGALDAFTRMNMQDELLRIHKKEKMTMVMVTHDVDEAVYLANKIVVMSARPAKIEEIINVTLSYPRDRNNSEFISYRSRILKVLDFAGKEKEPEYNI
ncbi:ABC transporter ATP-binding protein [Butyrivibrio sp. MC2013]|uniref:ABC transporter ATP-binding protein n=1 Tax=Butyrivibrio sp. MC2013 TaxID=1280686 RepID=UPI000419F858|nr:ABC transporter ATP-binding protein [Butyrivibrio sp. MC2013]